MPDNTPVSLEASEPLMDSGVARAKRSRLIGLLAISTAFGFLAESRLGELSYIAGTIGMVLLIVSWCQLDARERGYRLPRPLLVSIVLIGIIGVPFHLIRTRGVWGLWNCLLAVLFVGVMVAFDLIGQMARSLLIR